jgi:branched-chain amino acid transport system substrate-binding protein
VQDIFLYLKKGAIDAGIEAPIAEFFDPQTADFSSIFSKVKDSDSDYLLIILSHAASDVFVKQWFDAKVPVPLTASTSRAGRKLLSAARQSLILSAE